MAVPRDRKPTDLVVFPNSGKFFWGIIGGFVKKGGETERSRDGMVLFKGDTSDILQVLNFNGVYAIDDLWALSLETTYLISRKNEINSEIDKYAGLGDPTFSLLYRMMDMSKDGYDMNLSLGFSPKLLEAKDPQPSAQEGSNGKGRTDFGVGIEWGKRYLGFSWALSMALFHRGKEARDSFEGGTYTSSAYREAVFGGRLQWATVSGMMMGLDGNILRSSKWRTSSGLDDMTKSEYGLGASLAFPVRKGSFVKLGIAQAWDKHDGVFEEMSSSVDNQIDRTFHLGLIGQF